MSPKFLDKFWNFIGLGDDEADDDVDNGDEEMESQEIRVMQPPRKAAGNVVGLPSVKAGSKLVIYCPTRFEDVQVIVDHLKSRRPIIVNLEGVDNPLAKSLLDFICGATYALDGGMQKVNSSIFLIAPKDMDVASNLKETLLAKDALVKTLDPHLPAGGGSDD